MSNVFEAEKAVKAKFKKDTEGKGYSNKFYLYHDGQVVESEDRPRGNVPGYKFECKRNGEQVNCISLD